LVSVQNHYNLLHQADEADVLPTCRELNVGYLPYFPLASGWLTGKYRRGEPPAEGTRLQRWGSRVSGALTDDNFDRVERLAAWAENRGHTLLELPFAWLLGADELASVIAGATKVDQVEANAAAAGWSLAPTERAEVEKLAAPA
jgi:aryl-alcohol dehydrogenase-like predicted oxidoreductase